MTHLIRESSPMLCDAIRRLVGTHNEDCSTKISHVMDVRVCMGVCMRACVCVYVSITMARVESIFETSLISLGGQALK